MSTPLPSSVEPTSGSATPQLWLLRAKGDWSGCFKPGSHPDPFIIPTRVDFLVTPLEREPTEDEHVESDFIDLISEITGGSQDGCFLTPAIYKGYTSPVPEPEYKISQIITSDLLETLEADLKDWFEENNELGWEDVDANQVENLEEEDSEGFEEEFLELIRSGQHFQREFTLSIVR